MSERKFRFFKPSAEWIAQHEWLFDGETPPSDFVVHVVKPSGMALAEHEWWHLQDMAPHERRNWERIRDARRLGWSVQRALRDKLVLYPWEWFGHLTFESCESLTYAKREVGRWFNVLSRRVWGRNYTKRADEGLFAFVAFERQKRGDWHAHFLAAGTREMNRFDAMAEWHRPASSRGPAAKRTPRRGRKPKSKRRVSLRRRRSRRGGQRGFARIHQYDPGRGGAGYAVKYATKETDGDYSLIGRWRDIEG